MTAAPPQIFSKARKRARRKRANHLIDNGDADLFLLEDMADDIHERLAFVRHGGGEALIEGVGDFLVAEGQWQVDARFSYPGQTDFDDPMPFKSGSFDLVVSINSLDSVNDLPGALIQMRELLRPGGLAIATFIGGMSLLKLRRAMIDAEPKRPAARMHPLVDPRSCSQLLQRAAWRDPVVDSHVLTARYSALDRLVADLREQGLSNTLASPAPPLGKVAFARARQAFLDQADSDGKVSETFEIITLTGRR